MSAFSTKNRRVGFSNEKSTCRLFQRKIDVYAFSIRPTIYPKLNLNSLVNFAILHKQFYHVSLSSNIVSHRNIDFETKSFSSSQKNLYLARSSQTFPLDDRCTTAKLTIIYTPPRLRISPIYAFQALAHTCPVVFSLYFALALYTSGERRQSRALRGRVIARACTRFPRRKSRLEFPI